MAAGRPRLRRLRRLAGHPVSGERRPVAWQPPVLRRLQQCGRRISWLRMSSSLAAFPPSLPASSSILRSSLVSALPAPAPATCPAHPLPAPPRLARSSSRPLLCHLRAPPAQIFPPSSPVAPSLLLALFSHSPSTPSSLAPRRSPPPAPGAPLPPCELAPERISFSFSIS